MNEISQSKLRTEARKEWTANLKMGYLVVPPVWSEEAWLDHLAARTEYIVRQVPGVQVNWDFDGEAQAKYRAEVKALLHLMDQHADPKDWGSDPAIFTKVKELYELTFGPASDESGDLPEHDHFWKFVDDREGYRLFRCEVCGAEKVE